MQENKITSTQSIIYDVINHKIPNSFFMMLIFSVVHLYLSKCDIVSMDLYFLTNFTYFLLIFILCNCLHMCSLSLLNNLIIQRIMKYQPYIQFYIVYCIESNCIFNVIFMFHCSFLFFFLKRSYAHMLLIFSHQTRNDNVQACFFSCFLNLKVFMNRAKIGMDYRWMKLTIL